MHPSHKRSFAAEELARRQKKKSWLWIVVGVVVAMVIAGVGYVLLARFQVKVEPVIKETVPEQEQIKSIAVLPFVDMSPNKDQEHLGEGIADAVLNALTNIGDLKVIARSSSFKYIGEYEDIQAIGDTLGVESILEGSVLKTGAKIRVIAQLIRVADNSHIFSRQYDYEWKDIMAVQDSISLEVLKELKFTLMGKEQAAVVRRYTNEPDAYDLYLQGYSHFIKNLYQDDIEKSIHFFQQAVGKDPEFALAHAFLALGYSLSDRDMMKSALQKALKIDDSLAEVQYVAGFVAMCYDWDFPAAERALRKALAIKQGYIEARTEYATYLRAMGRYEEALVELKRARDDDPLNADRYTESMWLNISLNRYDEAMENYLKARELDPENVTTARHAYVRLLNKQGKYKEALDFFENEDFPEPGNLIKVYVLALSGNTIEARKLLDSTLKNREVSDFSQIVKNTWTAIACTGLGEYDTAFDYLNRAYEEREMVLIFIKDNFEFDPLRPDPRFTKLMKKIGLPED